LIFFRELEWLSRDHIRKIRPLLNHKERYIVHAAAVAVMASEDVKDRAFALRSLCMDSKVTRLAVYEVLYRFRKRDKEQWLDEGKELTLLITDPALPVSHRTSIAIAMGGMGYYYHARYLLDLLKNTPVNENNIPFIAGLIEALGMLHHPETILEIQRLLLTVNSVLILRASIHALARIDGKEGIEMLFHFLSQKYDLQIQAEAAIHIINIDILSYEWISEKFIPDDANPEIVKQIKAEIGHENFLAGV
jgi:HEAT repeat protein